jgi:DHA2 family multidrug resistance protein
MRNLGGAIGIAVVTTWLGDLTRINVARFGEALGEQGRIATDFVGGLADYIGRTTPDSAHALLQAQAEIVRVASANAMTLAFNDIFRLMSWIFLAALVMVPFCKPLMAAVAGGAARASAAEAGH